MRVGRDAPRRGRQRGAIAQWLACCALSAACAAQSPEVSDSAGSEADQAGGQRLASRALLPEESARPADAPHLAVGDDGVVAVVCASDDTILVTLSLDAGASWRQPVSVGSAGRLEHGLMRGPRVAVTPAALVVAAVCGDQLGGHDGDLLAWRSLDRGTSWLGPVPITDAPAAAREGLHALAADSAGRLLCAWLDLRHERTELWGNWSLDGGAHWSANACLYRAPGGGICECCPPAVVFLPADAPTPQSGIEPPSAPAKVSIRDADQAVVLWRNLLAGNRDLFALAVGPDGPADPAGAQPLGAGHWALDACPMAGGSAAALLQAAASDGSGRPGVGLAGMLSFWRRGGDLFTAIGSDAEQRWAAGRETHAASGPGGPHLLWTDDAGHVRSAVWPASASTAVDWGRGFNAAVAGAPDGCGPVLAVWESAEEGPGHVRIATLSPRAPSPESNRMRR